MCNGIVAAELRGTPTERMFLLLLNCEAYYIHALLFEPLATKNNNMKSSSVMNSACWYVHSTGNIHILVSMADMVYFALHFYSCK